MAKTISEAFAIVSRQLEIEQTRHARVVAKEYLRFEHLIHHFLNVADGRRLTKEERMCYIKILGCIESRAEFYALQWQRGAYIERAKDDPDSPPVKS